MGLRINADIYTCTFRNAYIYGIGASTTHTTCLKRFNDVQLAEVLSYLSDYLGADDDFDVRILTRIHTTDDGFFRTLRCTLSSELFDVYPSSQEQQKKDILDEERYLI